MKDGIKGLITIVALVSILSGLSYLGNYKEEKNKRQYNQIFLEETYNLPTKADSIYFYKQHKLEDYMVYENPLDTTKTFEEHIRLLDVPYSEMKRVVNE